MIDTDRITLAEDLYRLAEQFDDEAARWTGECRAQLERDSALLDATAIQTLTTGDPAVAVAYVDAAGIVLGNVRGARHLCVAVLTPPVHEEGVTDE